MATFYFVSLVILGSFFLLNIILAVILDSFDKVDRDNKKSDQKKLQETLRLKKLYGFVEEDSDEVLIKNN